MRGIVTLIFAVAFSGHARAQTEPTPAAAPTTVPETTTKAERVAAKAEKVATKAERVATKAERTSTTCGPSGKPISALRTEAAREKRAVAQETRKAERTVINAKPVEVHGRKVGTVSTYDDTSVVINLDGEDPIELFPQTFGHDFANATPYIFKVDGEDLQLMFGQVRSGCDTSTNRTLKNANVISATAPLMEKHYGESGTTQVFVRGDVVQDQQTGATKAGSTIKTTDQTSLSASALLTTSVDLSDNAGVSLTAEGGAKTCTSGKVTSFAQVSGRISVSLVKGHGCREYKFDVYCGCGAGIDGEKPEFRIDAGGHVEF